VHSTSRATVFLHAEDDEVVAAGDLWLVRLQESSRETHIERQRQIKERGFLAVMWPQLIAFLVRWVVFVRWDLQVARVKVDAAMRLDPWIRKARW
jgi:phage terminase large subunit-like protein